MRKFRCTACGHEFEVPYGTGVQGRQMRCPKCGGIVNRINGDFGQGRGRKSNR